MEKSEAISEERVLKVSKQEVIYLNVFHVASMCLKNNPGGIYGSDYIVESLRLM